MNGILNTKRSICQRGTKYENEKDASENELTKEPNNHTSITLMNFLSKRQISTILASTFKVPKSVQGLSKNHDIPIAACYRKVRLLEEMGFLRCVDRRLNQKGKRVRYYQCQIKHAHFFLESGTFRGRVQLNSGHVDDFDENILIFNERID